MSHNKTLILVISILLITVGQFACAVYLPSLPAIAKQLHSSPALSQLTYNVILFGYGASMLFYGGFSDYFGRKKLLLSGQVIFLVGSIITLLAPSITILLIGRLIQGLGLGSVGIGRAILRDIYDKDDFVKATTYISMSVTLTPLVAPLIGGYIQHYLNWRANFGFMLVYGLIIALLACRFIPETHTTQRTQFSWRHMASGYRQVLTHKTYLAFLAISLLAFSGEMAYNVTGPFLLQSGLHWNAAQYGWLALVTLLGYFVGAYSNSRLTGRLSRPTLLWIGLGLICLGSLFLLIFSSQLTTVRLLIPMIIFMMGIPIVTVNCGASAVFLFKENIGIVTALYGGLMLLISAILSSIVVSLHLHNQRPLAYVLLSFAVVAMLLALLLPKQKSA